MRYKLILIFIILIAFVLRFYRLGSVPISPDWDEVALGYNAYSILHTGRDEYAEFLPVILRSFDDYKPALYSYLIIPFIILFDLNVYAVRLPSAILGVIAVVVLYFLVKEFLNFDAFNTGKEKIKYKYVEYISLIAALLLAISPWHLQFSRIAFESNAGLAFNMLAILFFIKATKNPILLSLSGLMGVLSIYTYQSEKVFVPLMFVGLFLLFFREIVNMHKKYIIFAFVIVFLTLSPMLFSIALNPSSLLRAQSVSIFSDKATLLRDNSEKLLIANDKQDYLGILFQNRRVIYLKTIFANYLSHFDVNWLFIKGDYDINRHHAPNMALFYIYELPFLLTGIYAIVFLKQSYKFKHFILFWLFIAPLPAAFTNGVPHAVRALNMLPPLVLCTTLGFYHMAKILAVKKRLFIFCKIMIAAVFLLNFFYYLNQYFVQQNYYYAFDWQYGYKEIIDYIKPIRKNYKKVIVSNKGIMSQSYMFFLFYMKHNPREYLVNGGTSTGGLEKAGNKFENFEFRIFNYQDEPANTLLVGSPADFPEEYKVIHSVSYPDGNIAIKIVEK